MHRRTFLTAAATLAAAPRIAWAQGALLPRIALIAGSDLPAEMVEGGHPYWGALLSGLRELGHVEGETIAVERWSGSGISRDAYSNLIQGIAGTKPDIIVARGGTAINLARDATATIPIVGLGAFPDDLEARLARPGGNTTGIAVSFGTGLIGKMVQLLHDAIPSASRIAFVASERSWQSGRGAMAVRAAAEQFGLNLVPALYESPATEAKLRAAIASMAGKDIHAVHIIGSTELFALRDFLAEQMLAARLPAIGFQLEHARAGQLLSYAQDFVVQYRHLATFVDKILKGDDPGELPIQQPREIKFVVNLKTARALGITLPFRTLAFATEIID